MAMAIWTVLFLALGGYFAYQCWGRWRLLRLARTDDGRDYGSSTTAQRMKNTLIYAFGQKKFFRGDQPAGWMHAIIFWGFVVLLFQVISMFMRGWFPHFYVPGFTGNTLLGPYTLIKEFFEVTVFLGVLVGLSRWLITKPQRLMGILPAEEKLNKQSHWEAVVILIFIATIMTSGLFYDAGRYLFLTDDPNIPVEMQWGFVTSWIAGHLLTVDNAQIISDASWWIHNIVILVFMNLLPRSKHFHIITAIPNVYYGRVDPKGRLPKKDYEAEDALFGRSQANHFTQKQILDMYSCTECGRCSSVCPAAATGKTLAPRQMLLNLRDHVYSLQDSMLAPKPPESFDTVVGDDKAVLDSVVWSCVECRACEEACPVNIEYVDKIVDMRQHLVQEAARFPEELNRTFKGLETQSNPWGISQSERAAWAEGLNVPTITEKPDAEYLYYVGCGGSYDANNKKVTQSFVRVLQQAGVNFAILGNSETCNGETARRLGNEYLYQMMVEQLTTLINSTAVKKILVNCPHCFNTFKNEYPDYGGKWEIQHAAAFVNELVAEGKIEFECPSQKKKVVYHDSCYYGRFNDVYEDPRELLKTVGAEADEISPFCRDKGTCCGAGGGAMWMEEDKDKRVNMLRADQALEKGPQVIATSCPFCKIMLGSAINEKGKESDVKVLDVMEMVEESMQPSAPAN